MHDTSLDSLFSCSYVQARGRFCEMAHRKGFDLYAWDLPGYRGPDGETLSINMAVAGPRQADHLLITSSGVHGIEGFFGSAAQLDALGNSRQAPDNLLQIHVHALNPYGFAYLRRTNEQNVDLNRNLIDDYNNPPPAHALTEQLRPIILPPDWAPLTRARSLFQMLGLIHRHSFAGCQAAIMQGQYEYADSLFFGGDTRQWSMQVWDNILEKYGRDRKSIVHVDFHTGLGPFAQPTLYYSGGTTGAGINLTRQIWDGAVVDMSASGLADIPGGICNSFNRLAGRSQVASMALEIGTQSPLRVFHALLTDNFVRQQEQGNAANPALARTARQLMCEAFSPSDPAWRHAASQQARQIMQAAYKYCHSNC